MNDTATPQGGSGNPAGNSTQTTSSGGGTDTSSSPGNAPGQAVMGQGAVEETPAQRHLRKLKERVARLKREIEENPGGWLSPYNAVRNGLREDSIANLEGRIADLEAGRDRGIFSSVDDFMVDTADTVVEGAEAVGSFAGNRLYETGSDLASGDINRIGTNYVNRAASDLNFIKDMGVGAWNAVTTPSDYFQGARDAFAAGDLGGAGAYTADYLSTALGARALAKGLAARAGTMVEKGAMTVDEAAALRHMTDEQAEAAVLAAERRAAARERVEGTQRNERPDGMTCDLACTVRPVSLSRGAKVTFDRDFRLAGQLTLDLTRAYASDLDLDGPLGRNRLSAFDEMLLAEPDGSLFYMMGDGLGAGFERPGAALGAVSRNARHKHLKLTAAAHRAYVLEDRGIFRRFEKYPDGIWRLAEIRDRNENSARFQRALDGLLERIDRSDGFAFRFENADGLRRRVTLAAPDGTAREIAAYDYDDRRNLIVANVTFGTSFAYEYDAEDRLTAYRTLSGTHNRYVYGADGKVEAMRTRHAAFDLDFRYDAEGHRAAMIPVARPDDRRDYVFDAEDRLVEEANGLGEITRLERDCDGQILSHVDGEGARTLYAYDPNGHTASVTDPEGRRSLYRRDEDGRLLLAMDAESNAWEWGYDERGNLVWHTDPLGIRTDYSLDGTGRPVGIMRHDGLIESRSYDAAGNLTAITDFRGGRTVFERDIFGRIVAITDPVGATTRYEYAERRGENFWQATTLIRPDGSRVSRATDGRGAELTVTDAEGKRWLYRYGIYDLLTEIIDPRGGRLQFTYDHNERLLQVENQLGRAWTFERDAAGRVVRQTDFGGLTQEYGYDRAGRVTEARHADGARITYGYDRSGRLLEEAAYEPGADTPAISTYAYDARGLLIRAANAAALVEYERDATGRIVAETTNGRRVASVFNCCGDREEREIDGRLVTTLYDPLGALRELTIGSHAPLTLAHDKAGRERTRENGRGFKLEQMWDAAGRLTGQRGGPGIARDFGWTPGDLPEAIRDGRWGTTSYVADEIGQIVETRFGDGQERFEYDPALNLTGFGDEAGGLSAFRNGGNGRIETAQGPHGERINLTYDLRSRVVERRVERNGFRPQVWRYKWDARDRLVGCVTPDGEAWIYGYDPFGRRISKVRRFSRNEQAWAQSRFPALVRTVSVEADDSHGAWPEMPAGASPLDQRPPVVGTLYQWDGEVIAEEAPLRLDGTADWDRAVRWHYEPGSFVPMAREGADGTLTYVVTDHLGTPRELVDERGQVLWAAELRTWGDVRRLWTASADNDNARAPSGRGGRTWGALALKDAPEVVEARQLCPIRFQGQWEDAETGLSYNRFRHYDALVGQYASPDPIGLSGGMRPQGYVALPTAWADPLGLAACCTGKDIDRNNAARHNALKGYEGKTYQLPGGNTIRLTTDDMDHILARHHPDFYDGSVKGTQTFFDRSVSINDIENIATQAVTQQRGPLSSGNIFRTTRVDYNGTTYQVGFNPNGHIGQMFPLP
ncbi:RHS repeat-associated core domain-containing protein [Xanthobacteraceae bacterium A53D]